jgi:ADP-heptose:LPS heptosyltransferase
MSIKLYNAILNQKKFKLGWLFRLGLLLRSSLYFVYTFWMAIFSKRPSFHTIHSQDIQKILVLRPDRIGDFILFTPTLKLLKKYFPNAQIDLFIQKGTASIAACFEGWSQLHTFEDIDNPKERHDFIQKVHGQYQVVMVCSSMRIIYKMASQLKSNITLGWDVKGMRHTLSHPLDHKLWIKSNMHMVHINTALISQLAQYIEDWPDVEKESIHNEATGPDLLFPFQETDTGKEQYQQFIKESRIDTSKPTLVIHPSSFTYRVRWKAHKFAAIANKAHRLGTQVIFIGTTHDNAILDSVYKHLEFAPLSTVGQLHLQGTASLLRNASVFLGNSTGPMHLAAATGIPTVAIFGNRYPMDREEMWRPWGSNGHVVSVDKQICCQMPWTCKEMKCMTEIHTETVWDKIREFIQ